MSVSGDLSAAVNEAVRRLVESHLVTVGGRCNAAFLAPFLFPSGRAAGEWQGVSWHGRAGGPSGSKGRAAGQLCSGGTGRPVLINAACMQKALASCQPPLAVRAQVVVAAGNGYSPACEVSPASAPSALTVGASDQFDRRWAKSNWCVRCCQCWCCLSPEAATDCPEGCAAVPLQPARRISAGVRAWTFMPPAWMC